MEKVLIYSHLSDKIEDYAEKHINKYLENGWTVKDYKLEVIREDNINSTRTVIVFVLEK